MRPIQQQRDDPMQVLRTRLLILILIVLVLVMSRGVWGVYVKERESRVLRGEAEAQLQDLETREAGLREDIATLKSDRGLEGELRERYDLVREGEGVVVIVDQTPPPMPPPEPTKLEKIRHWFWW